MMTFCKLINVECDNRKNCEVSGLRHINPMCHGEIEIVLNWWEGIRKAKKELKEKEWLIKQDKQLCPYCKNLNLN